MTRKQYRRAVSIVAELKTDSLRQAYVYRAFVELFSDEENFDLNKFDKACDIADSKTGLKPNSKVRHYAE